MTPSGMYYTRTIPESLYSSSDTIYYQIWIQDNTVIYHRSAMKSFKCLDELSPSFSNIHLNSTPVYNKDLEVIAYIADNPNGDGLFNASLFIKVGGMPSKLDFDAYIPPNATPSSDRYYGFVIDKNYLSARPGQDVWYRIYAEDVNSLENTTWGIINVYDNTPPAVVYNDDNAGIEPLEGVNDIDANRSLLINYNITEPSDAIGLKEIKLLVKIGSSAPSSNSDFNFTVNAKEGITLLEGGTFNFEIGNGNYTYGDDVYVFVNATDLSDNSFCDYTSNQAYNIVDHSAPLVTPSSSNVNPASYHIFSKILTFTITEPSGGSGIKNATLYYQINDAGLSIPIINTIVINSYSNISSFNINDFTWRYGDIVYYRFIVQDNDLNLYNSGILNFAVSDLLAPRYIENPNNTNGWMYGYWKTFNITVWDPDYDSQNISAGVQFVRFYWKVGSYPTPVDNDGQILSPTIPVSVSKNLTTYLFNFTNLPTYGIPSVVIYYRFYIYDWAALAVNISSSTFTLYDSAYNVNSLIGPAAVIPTKNFDISFNLNFYTDVWYSIDGIKFYNLRIPFTNTFSSSFSLTEGVRTIRFYFMNNLTFFNYIVEIDLTPPGKVTDISYQLYGIEVVEITWDHPAGIDNKTVYRLYRSITRDFQIGPDTLLMEKNYDEDRSYEDTDIEAGVTYYYILVAVDRVGNVSPLSDLIVVSIPGNPIIMIILIGVIVSVAGAAIFVARKKISDRKREVLFSKVDMKSLDIEDFETQEITGPKWDTIQTKAPTVVHEGFQFVKEEEPLVLEEYWALKVGHLLSKAAKYELENEYAKALKLYSILIRFAKKTENTLLLKNLEAKKEEIYRLSSE